MPIVTVSRQYGSGGSEVAARIAQAMGWQVYDNDLVDQVAQRLGMSTAEVTAREERVPSLVERMTSAMALGVPEAGAFVSDLMARPTEERMVEMTQRVMEEAAQVGPAVIVGRGAQCMLAARSDALHVYCYASFNSLVHYAIEHLGIPAADAARRVQEVNHQRADYVKRHWKRDWRDFTNYDMCLNTARLGIDCAADLVIQATQKRFG